MAVNHFFIDPSFGQYIIGQSIKHVDRFFDVEKTDQSRSGLIRITVDFRGFFGILP